MWGGVFVLIILALLPMIRPGQGRFEHPEPRPGVRGDRVLPASTFRVRGVQHAYAVAAAIPGTLDGLYCYCDCSRHSGHRSLLSCFESAHGSQCDICMGQAEMAYRLLRRGSDLEEIRAAVDAAYGT